MNTDYIEILDIKIHRYRLEDAMNQIEIFLKSCKKHQICVTNVYSVVMMQKDEEFRKANNSSSLVVADGMPLVWVSRLFGETIPERISGADLFYELCKCSSQKGYSFFFLGSTQTVLNKMCKNLKEQFPDLRIVGIYSPPYKEIFSDSENLEMIKRINEVKPDILWVGMTAPKQEKWIYHNLDKIDVKIAIGVGAVFDFVAGTVKRAPLWMQKIGLEWLFRFMQEPHRLWKRYLIGNTIFLWLVLKEIIYKKILKNYLV
jgi:N-acetylglucosaminyldiphosphoundecaprenol N-acetyl-beta-D-mannosaminyltransferase